jgi:hypothetical protein
VVKVFPLILTTCFHGKNGVTENKMKKKHLTILSIFMIAIVSACGPAPTPTLTVEDLQATAAAAAWLAVTQTQAAIPTATATPIPPTATITNTPLPTFTPVPTFVPATAANTESACNQPPPTVSKGVLVPVKFVNKSGGHVNLSFGMNSPNTLGECVTYSYTLGEFDAPSVKVLAGCYWAYAWVEGSTPSTAQTVQLLCVSDPNSEPDIVIGTEVIAFK